MEIMEVRMAKNSYEANDLQVLEGLDAVRMRPGMYIGSTSTRGLHHLLWEIVDNAMDETANGYGNRISVILYEDGSASVEDEGRGIPVGIHKEKNMTGVELVFTQLHAGGKFGNDNYSYSGGLHGVGASVVNALSRWIEVEIKTGGYIFTQRFESVKDINGRIQSGKPVTKLEKHGTTRKTGTLIRFYPDDRVFDTIRFNAETIIKRLKELAFLNKGVHIEFEDQRKESKTKEIFYFEGGLTDFASYLNEDKKILTPESIYIEGEKDGIKAQIAIQYTDAYTDNIFSYVNNIPTIEGGMHETGFKTAITKVFNEYARKFNFLKEKDNNLTGEDFREGMTAVISIKMRNVQFEGQTKTKLGNAEARTALDNITTEQLAFYIDEPAHDDIIRMIIEKSIKAAKVRQAARKAREVARKKNGLEGSTLIGKLASCTNRKKGVNELFIVEGDSAGGSAKQGRDRRFQAILPLRGKPLNTEKKRLDQVLGNEEFRTIIAALGTGIGDDFNEKNLKYDKVIILSDADQDGAHIRAILLTFFFRYMRELITEGHVYIGMPPLYKLSRGKKTLYAYDDKELEQKSKQIGNGYTIQRYKGLGEMNPEQLWDTTMDPTKRAIIKVDIEDAAEADKLVTTLMGDKVDPRRQYISKNANFNRTDLFEEMEG